MQQHEPDPRMIEEEETYYAAFEQAVQFVDSGAVSIDKFIEDLRARLCK
ncbi:MAG: hypothetical protein R8M45_11890 [Ghiorsea sp.]